MKHIFLALALMVPPGLFAQFYVGPATHLVVEGNTNITVHDLSLLSEGSVEPGSGTFRFSGRDDTNIGGSTPMNLFNVNIAKSLQEAVVTILQNLKVTNNVEMSSGLLNLGVRTLDLGYTGQVLNEQENSRIYSNSSGEVVTRRILNAPSAENPGNLGLSISSSANLGEIVIRRGHLSQTNGNGQGNSILRYYEVNPANNNSLDATLRFQYFDAELNSIPESSLMMWSSPDNSAWTNRGYTMRDAAANFVELENISAMMRFTLSSAAAPLPVEGLNLTGRWENERSELRWTTLAEYNNSHFNVRRKYSNEQIFANIGRVNSYHVTGTSQIPSTYYFTDAASSARGSIFYQLEQADLDGQVSYSNTVSIDPTGSKKFINYVAGDMSMNNIIQIKTGDMNLETMTVIVYDAAGRVYMHRQVAYSNQQIHMPPMARGVYYVKIRSGQHQFVTSFIK